MFAVEPFGVIIPRTIKEGRSSALLSRGPDCLDTGKAFQWDAEGRMVSINNGAAGLSVFNALGQRVEKYTGTAYTEIAYDAFGNQIGTHNQTTWGTYFVPLGGRTLVRYQDNKTYFLHPNHLGSTTFVTDETGATIQKTIYYPWGQTWASSATVKDSRFASMDPRDSETANDPTLFRMYQPRLYRWLSPDPVAGDISNPQSLNRYAYVLNNPTNFIDPLGLDGYRHDCPHPMPPMPPMPPGGGSGGDDGGGGSGGGRSGDVFEQNDPTVLTFPAGPTIPQWVVKIGAILRSTWALGGACLAIPGCWVPVAAVGTVAVAYTGYRIYQSRKRDIQTVRDAAREIERRCGRDLRGDELERLHNLIHDQGLDYKGIVQWGVNEFCPGH